VRGRQFCDRFGGRARCGQACRDSRLLYRLIAVWSVFVCGGRCSRGACLDRGASGQGFGRLGIGCSSVEYVGISIVR